MSFNNIDNLSLGNLLQIAFSNGVRNQISQDFRDFEMIKRAKVGNSAARELRFMFQRSLGAAAIQYRDPGTSGRSFPDSDQVSLNENIAKFKEINATIELEQNLYARAQQSPEKYAEPLSIELDSKASAAKRRLAADLYGDGSGVVGTITSQSLSSGSPVVTLTTTNAARGHVGFFEFEDKLVHKAANGGAGTSVTLASGTFSYWRVRDKDRDNSKVTLRAVDTTGAEQSVSSWSPSSGEVFYRNGQPTIPNLGSISDYGTATEVIAGLESLVANDGRAIHGITMSGAYAGTRRDCGGNPIDVKDIQRVMSKVKNTVGQDRYKWKMMTMAPETLDAMIESRETDRRFTSMEDAARGTKKFVYQHLNDSLECYTTEFCPPKRLYILPEAKGGDKVIEFHGSDFETIKGEGMNDFHLKPSSSGGYVNTMVSYLQAIGVIICKHPASVAVLENFTNS
jgi:hypothetical protein